MFAPPVKIPKPKTTSSAVPTRAPIAPHHVSWRPGAGSAEQMFTLQRTSSNQAALWALRQEAERPTGSTLADRQKQDADRGRMAGAEAAPSTSRDFFGEMPLLEPDRPGGPEARSPLLQTKLAIGEVNDPLEHEADRVADQVPLDSGREALVGTILGQGENEFRRNPEVTAGADVAPVLVREVLRAPGQPLDPPTRAFFEPRFGHDFSRVRVHTGMLANRSAHDLNASAYTMGRNIVFGLGRFAPGTHEGRRLLAHELTHVVQQSGGQALQDRKGPRSISGSGPALQRDSDKKKGSSLKHITGASKALSKGVLIWSMWIVKNSNQAIMSMVFSPFPPYRGKAISFLQTLRESSGGNAGDPALDVLTYGYRDSKKDDTEPFYGADWNNKDRNWAAEGAPGRFRNQPGGAADPNAYFFDVPMVYSGQTKMFEAVVVVPETTEILAAITWGVKGDGDKAKVILPPASDPTDRPTAGFLVAVDRFYEQPSTLGPDILRPERYDAILDRFPANDATLTTGQKNLLDPIAAKVKERNDPTIYVSIGGFADATEKDPSAISETRAKAVESYLIAQGLPKSSVVMDGFFGAAWARYPPSPTEDRNRRVQVRIRWGPPPGK